MWPTAVVLGTAWLLCAIRAFADLFCRRLPQWGIEVADWISSRLWSTSYYEEAAWRLIRLKNSLRGFDTVFLACCDEVRSKRQQGTFCYSLASYVREGKASEDQVAELLEQTAWEDAVFWFTYFLHNPLDTAGEASLPRA